MLYLGRLVPVEAVVLVPAEAGTLVTVEAGTLVQVSNGSQDLPHTAQAMDTTTGRELPLLNCLSQVKLIEVLASQGSQDQMAYNKEGWTQGFWSLFPLGEVLASQGSQDQKQ